MERPVDSGSMTAYVAAELRQMIFNKQLASNQPIRQEQLATVLGVSRIPVREALRQLESEGLVVVRPNHGARVAILDLEECVESYKIRERLEPLAIAESIPHLADDQIEHIAGLAESLRALGPNPAGWQQGDREFHLATYGGLSTQRLMKMIESLWNSTQHYRRALFSTFTTIDFEVANAEHFLIVQAIRNRDVRSAEATLGNHIRRSRERLAASPHLFDS